MIHCKVCNLPFNAINKRHLASHGLTREDYISRFPDAELQSPESAAKRKIAALERHANMSAETKIARSLAMSEARKGKSSWNLGKGGYKLEWSEEAKQRVKDRGSWNRGILATEEQKQKQSDVMKEGYASGKITHWNIGNVTPEEVRKKISEGCKGFELTLEQKEKHIEAMRFWVSSPDYNNHWQGKRTPDECEAITKRNLICAPKVRATMEANGYWVPLAQLPEMIKYRREVWKHTNKNADLIPNYDPSKRGRCSKTEDNWQIDHKLSITQGWLDGISAKDLSHPANLEFIPWRENLAKFAKSTLTKEELGELIL